MHTSNTKEHLQNHARQSGLSEAIADVGTASPCSQEPLIYSLLKLCIA